MLIKRYINRKLYDPSTHKWTTLSKIREHVQSGGSLKVLDYHTGQDVTRDTLARIVAKIPVPVNQLTELIQTTALGPQ